MKKCIEPKQMQNQIKGTPCIFSVLPMYLSTWPFPRGLLTFYRMCSGNPSRDCVRKHDIKVSEKNYWIKKRFLSFNILCRPLESITGTSADYVIHFLCPKLLSLENPLESIWDLKSSVEIWKFNLNLIFSSPLKIYFKHGPFGMVPCLSFDNIEWHHSSEFMFEKEIQMG